MPKTTLTLVNDTLTLIGEQSLLNTSGSLGKITRDAINTAILSVAQDSRANVFESTLTANVTANDYLTPALTLTPDVMQVYSVALRISTGSSLGDKLVNLEYLPLDAVDSDNAYSIVGSNIYVSPSIARPHTLFLQLLKSIVLPVSDATDSGLPDAVIPSVQHTAAAILALSYLDDNNQASVQQNIADRLVDKLRKQYGNTRAKSFNISGNRNKSLFASGGISPINASLAYAPLTDAALLGNATLNGSPIQTLASVSSILLGNYLTIPAAASTYAPIASPTFTGVPAVPTAATATSTTQIASTAYVKNNLSVYALLASPVLTGNPQAPTQAVSTNSDIIASTAFVKNSIQVFTSTVATSLVTGNNTLQPNASLTCALGTNTYRYALIQMSFGTSGSGKSLAVGTSTIQDNTLSNIYVRAFPINNAGYLDNNYVHLSKVLSGTFTGNYTFYLKSQINAVTPSDIYTLNNIDISIIFFA